MRVPSATYRLQLGPSLDLRAVREAVPYLEALGVTDLYLSPLLASRPGSTHGYDVVDPTRLDPELGTEEDLRALAAELRSRGMGLLLDVVPNHMAADEANPWWWDVLRQGRSSPHASVFDIDWAAPGLEGRVLLPILGEELEEAVASGDLRLDERAGEPVLRYHDRLLPVAPGTAGGDVREVIDRQAYVPADWRRAMGESGFRRFFDITDLVCVRTEDPAVLEATHAVVLGWVRDGLVTGVRVDHVDGLWDPAGYLAWLRERCGDVYVVVEKILGPGEDLPQKWPVAGTTGYEAMDLVNRLLVDRDGLDGLERVAVEVGGPEQGEPFDEVVRARKRQVARQLFGGEVASLARRITALAPQEVAVDEVGTAVVEVSAALPVYRTYVRTPRLADRDRRLIETAAQAARPRAPADALDLVRSVLLLVGPSGSTVEDRLDTVMRWQQLTGPLAAKGLEDTALYRWNRLVSLNEVGGEPGAGALEPEGFHRAMAVRAERWPHAMSATATHDTKRGEDVRARISVLSEVDEWPAALRRVREAAGRHVRRVDGRPAPDGAEELLLYQTVAGMWPPGAGRAEPELVERLQRYMVKAAREGKTNTSWIDIDTAYEAALTGFVADALADPEVAGEMIGLARRIEVPGAVNALAQLVVKLTMPGVPDLYQGTERWHLLLVDPDNRQPVDLAEQARLLAELDAASDRVAVAHGLLDRWQDGRVKLFLLAAVLRHRRENVGLFRDGEYVALGVDGPHRSRVVAFARRARGRWAVTVVPRRTAGLSPGRFPLGEVWEGTAVVLPPEAPERWTDVATAADRPAPQGRLAVDRVLADLPVAVLGGER